jgi:hypothetical protein
VTATVGDWLGLRTPAPPAALLDRMRQALGDMLGAPATEAHEHCLAAAERLVRDLSDAGLEERAAALDLLAADALTTYALEAAADDPSSLDRRADEAMQRLSRLGAPL